MAECFIREDLRGGALATADGAAQLLHWAREIAAATPPGDVYRDKEGRRTLRIHHGGRSFFLKLHAGVGWPEIFKNLLQGRLPATGGRDGPSSGAPGRLGRARQRAVHHD